MDTNGYCVSLQNGLYFRVSREQWPPRTVLMWMLQVSVSRSPLRSFARSDQPRISPQAMKSKAVVPDVACMENPPSWIISYLSEEAGLYLCNGQMLTYHFHNFFHDCFAEPDCWRPWEHQPEHNTNFFLSLQFTFNRDENKSPSWLSIIRHLTRLRNVFKSQAKELERLLIYYFDIKSRESQILKAERPRVQGR